MDDTSWIGSSVGVAVRDLDAVVELYSEGFGLGPFERSEIESSTATLRGAPSPTRIRVATAPLGDCEMELIEVVGGRPPHAEFLDDHGEGMNHFNLDKLTTQEYLETLGRLYHRGIEPYWGYPFNSFCYVEGRDGEGTGGVTFEVMVGSGHAGKKGFHHLGLVVADTDRTIDFYSKTMGLGPFRTNVFPMNRAFYREARIEASFKASFCDLGETELRLYQVLEGDNPLSESLGASGEGMHHLALHVSDLEARLEQLASAGIETGWIVPEAGIAHLETKAIGGMTFALHQAGRRLTGDTRVRGTGREMARSACDS